MWNRIMFGVYIVIIFYVIVSICYFFFCYYIFGVFFLVYRDGFGVILLLYVGIMIVILIVVLMFLIGSRMCWLVKIREYGYMILVVIVYVFSFVEFGVLFFCGLLFFFSISGYMIFIIVIGIVFVLFIYICIFVF